MANRNIRSGTFATSRAALAAARAIVDTGMNRKLAARAFGASEGSVYAALAVVRSKNADVIARVDSGQLSVYSAGEMLKGNEPRPHRYVRLTEELFQRLHGESTRSGVPIRHIVHAAVEQRLSAPSDPPRSSEG